ncbi:MAG: GNAT family N-acetyltransferase [Nitratireductor sp.]|nr:GNAT family N-acetyltransferase [Nitratireductor sp.]
MLEASGFRSFPSTTTRYDGTWAIRMTAGHPAKRLNCVNPLDPDDCQYLEERIALARQKFAGFGRPFYFRLTPLAPKPLIAHFTAEGWTSFEESLVMLLDLTSARLPAGQDRLPLQDAGRWVDAQLALSGTDPAVKPGFVEIIGRTEPETGLFLHQEGDAVASVVRCVCDMRICGIFDLATHADFRGRGYGTAMMTSALKWAWQRGARKAWLQVVADNRQAIALYERLGFREIYRYAYWQPPSHAIGEPVGDDEPAGDDRP